MKDPFRAFFLLALSIGESVGISRVEVIQRAQFWQDRNVPYSQSGTYPDPNGIHYRRDCSGFISMCWKLEPHGIGCPWTGNLGRYCNRISRSDLQPGDILLNEAQHVILFEKWANDAHSEYWAFEEVDVGINMKYRSKRLPGNDYFACRYKYIDGAHPDTSHPSGTPCAGSGGQCIAKDVCTRTPLEKINNAWSCPGTPDNVWCCIGGKTPKTSPCQEKGGDCINRYSCSANALERIDGKFSCPDDGNDIWCCLPGGGFVIGGTCERKGGKCQNRRSCRGKAVEKIDGNWSCPGTPDDVWCCLPGESLCQSKGGSCIDMSECRRNGKNPVEKFGTNWSCPGTGNNIQCCV